MSKAANSFYTQEQLELAKMQLAELPDLNASRMKGKDVLSHQREQLVELSFKKGYSVAEIKSAVDLAGITVSIKAIKEAIDTGTVKSGKKPVVQKSANAKTSEQVQSKSS